MIVLTLYPSVASEKKLKMKGSLTLLTEFLEHFYRIRRDELVRYNRRRKPEIYSSLVEFLQVFSCRTFCVQ